MADKFFNLAMNYSTSHTHTQWTPHTHAQQQQNYSRDINIIIIIKL